jgi:hypothetical protein
VAVAAFALASAQLLGSDNAPFALNVPDKGSTPADVANSTNTNPNCSRDISTTSLPQTPTPAATAAEAKTPSLESTGPADPINVGGGEGTASTDIVLTASPALAATITPPLITIDIPQRFRRSGNKLATEYLPDPTFSSPRIIESRKVISFRLCFDTNKVAPGSYIGQVVVSAPGIQPATVAVTLNDKNTWLFVFGGIGAVLAAFTLLWFQAAQTKWQQQAAAEKSVRKALREPFSDLFRFWGPTVFAILAAAAAMWQVYSADPAWGADWGTSVIALVGTAIAAAGLGTLLSGFKRS